ncbi:MAG: DNA-3-methyladenine glycosylase [Alphaproteobacteria bacterium]
MPEKQEKKPPNIWYEGPVYLHDLPEIGKGLKALGKNHPALKAAHKRIGTLPWKKQPDDFAGLVYIILGQQVSVAAAAHMVARLKKLTPEITPRRFLKLDDAALREIGLSRQKMAYCRDLAEGIIGKKFSPGDLAGMDDTEAFEALTALKGIGPWSAEIYLMFSLGRADIWPAGDLGLQAGLQRLHGLKTRPDIKKTRQMGEIWAPYRSAASLIVWRA